MWTLRDLKSAVELYNSSLGCFSSTGFFIDKYIDRNDIHLISAQAELKDGVIKTKYFTGTKYHKKSQ